MPPAALAVLGIVLGIIGLAMMLMIFNYGQIWFQAYWSKAAVTFLELLGMSLRKVNARTIVQARIMATQAGLGKAIPPSRLEAHYLAGGDVPRVIRCLLQPIGLASISTMTVPVPSTWLVAICSMPSRPV